VNKTLEAARTGKLIGSSLEAKVYLRTSDDGLAVRLNEMCEAKNDADTLHRIFLTSQVCMLVSLARYIPVYICCTVSHLLSEKKWCIWSISIAYNQIIHYALFSSQ